MDFPARCLLDAEVKLGDQFAVLQQFRQIPQDPSISVDEMRGNAGHESRLAHGSSKLQSRIIQPQSFHLLVKSCPIDVQGICS